MTLTRPGTLFDLKPGTLSNASRSSTGSEYVDASRAPTPLTVGVCVICASRRTAAANELPGADVGGGRAVPVAGLAAQDTLIVTPGIKLWQ